MQKPTDLAQRRSVNLVIRSRRLEIEQGLDVAAHRKTPRAIRSASPRSYRVDIMCGNDRHQPGRSKKGENVMQGLRAAAFLAFALISSAAPAAEFPAPKQ